MARSFAAGMAVGIVGTVLAAVAVSLAVVYTGAYNVAAGEPHADIVRWTLDTALHRSVSRRAGEIDLAGDPPRVLIEKGAGHYAHTCVQCHGAPGREAADWARGMRPEPPSLVEAAGEWRPREIHWIVNNGIRMSGMPAIGEGHSEEDVLALTAFVSALPGLTEEDYETLTASAHGHGGHEAPGADREPNGRN